MTEQRSPCSDDCVHNHKDRQADEPSHQSEWKKPILCFHKQSWVGSCTQMTEILLAQKLILWLGQRFSICKFIFFWVAVVIAFYKLQFGIIIEGLKNVEKVVGYKYHYCIEVVVQTGELKWVFFIFQCSQISKFLRHCCIVHNIHDRVTTSRRWTWCFYLWKHSSAIDFMRTEVLGLKVFVQSTLAKTESCIFGFSDTDETHSIWIWSTHKSWIVHPQSNWGSGRSDRVWSTANENKISSHLQNMLFRMQVLSEDTKLE